MNKKWTKLVSASTALALCMSSMAYAGEETYTIGICQYVQHDALDLSTQGFKDALSEQLGDRVTFDEQNAQGDSTLCATIINSFVSSEADLILANATTALQAAATATADIPILGTSVTEYGAALQIEDFEGITGRNISGTSDLAPLDVQAAVIKELLPDASTVGLLYCSAEPNSQYQIEVVEQELLELGFTCERYPFADSYDISAVTMNAAAVCDVIYVPTDNTAASNAELIANICIPEGIPVIAGEENACKLCGIATFSINYYDLGYTTGLMAARILIDGEDITSMPIEYASDFTKKYHPENCSVLGIEVPEEYIALELE